MEKSWQIAERIWDATLTPTQKLVALAILHHRNSETGLCFPSAGRIASVCGVSVPTVRRTLRVLKDRGMVKNGGWKNRFRVLRFCEVSSLRVMGITGDTPGLSPTIQVSPFLEGIGEDLSEEDFKEHIIEGDE